MDEMYRRGIEEKENYAVEPPQVDSLQMDCVESRALSKLSVAILMESWAFNRSETLVFKVGSVLIAS